LNSSTGAFPSYEFPDISPPRKG